MVKSDKLILNNQVKIKTIHSIPIKSLFGQW